MNGKKLISLLLTLALLLSSMLTGAFAEEPKALPEEEAAEASEIPETVSISYRVTGDARFGVPEGSNVPDAATVRSGEEFVLEAALETHSISALDLETGDLYIGEWVFTGWEIPVNVYWREVTLQPEELAGENWAELITETYTEIRCTVYNDAQFSGSWEFIPRELQIIPEEIESAEQSLLTDSYDSLSDFWPERASELNKVYNTGLFPESIIRYINMNIQELPVKDKSFVSVPLADTERQALVSALKEACAALSPETDTRDGTMAELLSLVQETEKAADEEGKTSGSIGYETAFIVYCAEKAGLVDAQSRAFAETADMEELYAYITETSRSDIITLDELLQIYKQEDCGDEEEYIVYNDEKLAVARDGDWYDTENLKSEVLPGDLIVFKDAAGAVVTMGIISAVDGRSISYVICGSDGIPGEYSVSEEELALLKQNGGAGLEIIGLRVNDPSRIVYEFLTGEMALPEAAALGVMGNIYNESRFSATALGDGYTSFGLCQWHNDRFWNLVIFCMKNDYNIASLEGQLKYLQWELEGSYASLTAELRKSGCSATWAYEAADRFCRVFEQPADADTAAAVRGNTASGALWDAFSPLFIKNGQTWSVQTATGQVQGTVIQETTVQESKYIIYTVKEGDTLGQICRDFGLEYGNHRQEIIKLNNLLDENLIYPGQIIILPNISAG